ncbi:hypothetical protein RI367_000475 [Sorochytrium milnesiophthora]
MTLGALLAVVALLLASVDARGLVKRAPAQIPAGAGIAPHRYIVELEATPTLVRDSQSSHQEVVAQQNEFRAAAHADNIQFEERRAFTDLFNGVSVKVADEADAERLAQLPGVKAVWPIVTYSHLPRQSFIQHDLAQTADILPQLKFAHNMTNVNKVHVDLGLKGKGIKIGVIDSGIDYLHPAFAEPGKTCTSFKGDGCRVKYGQDFVGDDFDSKTQPIPHPSASPMDCGGHGTHVAGISAGHDLNITGVAPEATLGAYRVFGCEGSTSSEVIIAAMEQAYKDGMDTINLSIGGGTTFSSYPHSVVASRLSDLGLMVQSALGNDGSKGMFHSSSPGVAAHAFGVGSFDNIFHLGESVNITTADGTTTGPFELGLAETKQKFSKGQTYPVIASNNDVTVKDDGCAPFPADHFKGAVALIRRGTCPFTTKAKNAQAASAVGVFVYNNAIGHVSPDGRGVDIPMAAIEAAVGEAVVKDFAAGKKPTVTFLADLQTYKTITGGQPSDFSSWGPGPDLAIKPDIAAPGGLIYSAYPRAKGSYAVLSGTSMATPYFTGLVALWIEQNKGVTRANLKFDVVRQAAQNAGKPADVSNGLAYPVPKQGPGLIDALQFLHPVATVTPSRIALRDVKGANKRRQVKLTVRNTGTEAQTFTLSHRPAASVTGINATVGDLSPAYSTEVARVTFSQPAVRLAKGASADVTATINLGGAALPDNQFWHLSGYIVVAGDKTANTTAVHVPYHAMKGDYSQYPIVADPTGKGAPLISDVTATTDPRPAKYPVHNNAAEEVVFSMTGTDLPVMQLSTVHPTRLLSLVAVDAATDKELGYILYETFVQPMDSFVPSTKGVYGWDTTVFPDAKDDSKTKKLGDGKYYWKLSVVPASSGEAPKDLAKALVTVWRSPVLVINSGKAGAPTPSPTAVNSTTASATATATPAPTPKYRRKHTTPTPAPTPAPPKRRHN